MKHNCVHFISVFIYLEMYLFCLHFLKDSFIGYRILLWTVLFFQHFQSVIPFPLAFIVSDGKSAIYHTVYLYVTGCFSFIAFKIYLWLPQFNHVSRYGFLCVCSSWGSVCFLDMKILFHQIQETLGHIFFKILLTLSLSVPPLLSFWESYYMYVGVLHVVHRSLVSVHFSSILFALFFKLDNFY